MTYAIVARDPATGEMGAAAQSHFFGACSEVIWAEAGSGVVATMAVTEPTYGRFGIELMRKGMPAQETLLALLEKDVAPSVRQLGLLGVQGDPAGYTGSHCIPAAGYHAQANVIALGNMLTNDGTWIEMVSAFNHASGSLAARLLVALQAGERAGGDIRGKQAAGLVVVGMKKDSSVEANGMFETQPRTDLRVEDSPDPLRELSRLLAFDVFYKELLGLLSIPGLIVGPFTASKDAVDAAVATLVRGQELLQDNQEATFWLAILFAKSGNANEARKQFAAAARVHPPLRELARRLVTQGLLGGDELRTLTA